ncbi:MAG: hypothetical protein ABIH01_04345 [Candidatus Omnitrophota bacterium]
MRQVKFYIAIVAVMSLIFSATKAQAKSALEAHIDGAVLYGFENNVNLDPTRKGDNFVKGNIVATLKYPIAEKVKLKGGFEFIDTTYWRYTDYSTMDAIFHGGAETQITEKLLLTNHYDFEILRYPRNERFNYLTHTLGSKLKYFFNKNIYYSFGYEFLYKDYDKLTTYLSSGLSSDKRRNDYRNVLKEELGLQAFGALFRLRDEYYFNKSNDKYMDYYNYSVYKISASAYRPIINKLSAMCGAAYQWRWYDNRRISIGEKKERDRSFTTNGALIYEINKYLSWMANYAYVQNYSNDPIQRYSESIMTSGIFFSF